MCALGLIVTSPSCRATLGSRGLHFDLNTTNCVLEGFSSKPLAAKNSFTFTMSSVNSLHNCLTFLPALYRETSSAYCRALQCWGTDGSFLTDRLKREGPKTEPCGTPLLLLYVRPCCVLVTTRGPQDGALRNPPCCCYMSGLAVSW